MREQRVQVNIVSDATSALDKLIKKAVIDAGVETPLQDTAFKQLETDGHIYRCAECSTGTLIVGHLDPIDEQKADDAVARAWRKK